MGPCWTIHGAKGNKETRTVQSNECTRWTSLGIEERVQSHRQDGWGDPRTGIRVRKGLSGPAEASSSQHVVCVVPDNRRIGMELPGGQGTMALVQPENAAKVNSTTETHKDTNSHEPQEGVYNTLETELRNEPHQPHARSADSPRHSHLRPQTECRREESQRFDDPLHQRQRRVWMD